MKKNNESKIYNILVIEDEEAMCELIKCILAQTNYYIETFTSSRKALERFDEYPFDLVIIELQMPDFNGLNVARRVKKKNPSIKVILVNGTQMEYGEKYLSDLGIDFVLSKPFKVDKLLEVVTRILGSSRNK